MACETGFNVLHWNVHSIFTQVYLFVTSMLFHVSIGPSRSPSKSGLGTRAHFLARPLQGPATRCEQCTKKSQQFSSPATLLVLVCLSLERSLTHRPTELLLDNLQAAIMCVTPKYFNQCTNCEVQHSHVPASISETMSPLFFRPRWHAFH